MVMKPGPLLPPFPLSAMRDAGLVVSKPHTFLVLMSEGAENKAAELVKGNTEVINLSHYCVELWWLEEGMMHEAKKVIP